MKYPYPPPIVSKNEPVPPPDGFGAVCAGDALFTWLRNEFGSVLSNMLYSVCVSSLSTFDFSLQPALGIINVQNEVDPLKLQHSIIACKIVH